MTSLSEDQLLQAFVAIAVVLLLGRGLGEVSRRIGLPEVLGQFFAGVLLGPSVFGFILPGLFHTFYTNSSTGFVLSSLSWLGAIFLLLAAGLEVDAAILRAEARAGTLTAIGAIVPSIIAGVLFSLWVLHPPALANALFLGILFSVTAVGVVAKIFIESQVLRRRYAQVIIAAGVASEVLVWLMVAVVSSAKSGSPVVAVRAAIFAVGFFAIMLTLGRRFVFWTMRRVADSTSIVRGQLTLIVVLMLLFGALTLAMGLHPLLGAFVLGVLLAQAPRRNRALLDNIQTLTSGFFAPIFFVLAGTRVNIFQLSGVSSIGIIVLLFIVSTAVKVLFSFIGARLGGFRPWEDLLVAVGMSMKGGTDVLVAIVGVELHLLTSRVYTIYVIVAILSVFITPPIISRLAAKSPPLPEEQERLEAEERERRAYLPKIERVLLPIGQQFLPGLVSELVQRLALAKHSQQQIFDITEYVVETPEMVATHATPHVANAVGQAQGDMRQVADLNTVEVTRRTADERHTLRDLIERAGGHDLVAMGAHAIPHHTTISFGRAQDAIIQKANADVLIVAAPDDRLQVDQVRRILVPISGLAYSAAAADIAGSLLLANLRQATEQAQQTAQAADAKPTEPEASTDTSLTARTGGIIAGATALAERTAERLTARTEAQADAQPIDLAALVPPGSGTSQVVLLHVVTSDATTTFWNHHNLQQFRRIGQSVVENLASRLRTLGVPVDARMRVSTSVPKAILNELNSAHYDLVVMGSFNRGLSGRPYLGGAVNAILRSRSVPMALLIVHDAEGEHAE